MAKPVEEIILAYPALEAIAIYRMAHLLYEKVPLIPRIMTEWAHSRTGIDIHPGAQIGSHFFIDHGTGVVIGETTEIGARVKLYHAVTLGARSFQKDEHGKIKKGGKRHPTVEDDVTIYPGSTILGGETVIGARSTMGATSWRLCCTRNQTRSFSPAAERNHATSPCSASRAVDQQVAVTSFQRKPNITRYSTPSSIWKRTKISK